MIPTAVRSAADRVPGVPLYWSRITGPIRLPDEAPVRVVHLRDASLGPNATASATQLVLARRELRADINLTPKNPRPGDTIEARVMVWDPSGRVDPTAERITLEAMLDLDPVAVAWQRAGGGGGGRATGGNGWTARIQTRRTDRPSVVRVVARDSAGAEIGRGFLEVAGGH